MTRIARLVIAKPLLCAGAWALVLPAGAFAQPAGIRPGKWEMEQVFEVPNAPPGGFRNQWQHCVRQEDAKKGPVFADLDRGRDPAKGECRIEELRYPARGHVTYDIVCGAKQARIHVEYRYTDTTFEGTTRMAGAGRGFTQRMKGRYLGPC